MKEEKICISIEEARQMLGIGRNLMLELIKTDGFPCIRFKRKVIIDKKKFIDWISDNYGKYSY